MKSGISTLKTETGDFLNEQDLERYIRLYHGTIYRLGLSFLKNSADSEDLCSEVFFRLYKYNGIFEADENCKAWLIRVAANLAKSQLKSVWHSRRSELDENIPKEEIPDYGLYEAVMKLPQKYSIVIHLYYFEGYSAKEIAEIIKVPVSTVTTRLTRGRRQLKTLIEKESLQ